MWANKFVWFEVSQVLIKIIKEWIFIKTRHSIYVSQFGLINS